MRTKFESLFDRDNTVVALAIVAYWHESHRRYDDRLFRAAGGMIRRGELSAERWEGVLEEAAELDGIIKTRTECERLSYALDGYAFFEPCLLGVAWVDLAISAGEPLDDTQTSVLHDRLDLARHQRAKQDSDATRNGLAYWQGMLGRAAANANGAAEG